jgi:hypothetical protein
VVQRTLDHQVLPPVAQQRPSKLVRVLVEASGVHSIGDQTSTLFNPSMQDYRDWSPMQHLWILDRGDEAHVKARGKDLVPDH